MTTAEIVVVVAKTLENPHTIVSAFDHIGPELGFGFTLAACCAMVEDESGGRMIWGADPWDPAAYPRGLALPVALQERPVTEADYHAYRYRRQLGCQPQGCGITQLTSPGLQQEAERAGGCWVPFYNCLTGFRVLRALCVMHGSAIAAFAAYNGSGPAAVEYGQRVEGLRVAWQQRFNAAAL